MSESARRTGASPTSPSAEPDSPRGGTELGRRTLFRGTLATLLLAGCGGAGAAPPARIEAPSAAPPLAVAKLTSLLALARLRWVILVRPREIASLPFLIPSLGQVISEERFARFALSSGIDLRQVTEAAVATYADKDGDVTFSLVRHNGDPAVIERLFRRRFSADERRVVERPDLTRVSGKIGARSETMVVLGRDVVGYQQGGSTSRGPARVAALYATGKLTRSPSLLAEEPICALATRFGATPAQAFALGPFEGELARGARGLLAGATAIGAAVRPSARDGIGLVLAVAGDFTTSGAVASAALLAAWNDLATGGFGHLLALDEPVEPPLATHGPGAVTVAVELDPKKLARGLAAATSGTLAEIMR